MTEFEKEIVNRVEWHLSNLKYTKKDDAKLMILLDLKTTVFNMNSFGFISSEVAIPLHAKLEKTMNAIKNETWLPY